MKRTSFDESKDQQVARDTGVQMALMCSAHGCPNRWAVDGSNGKCCSRHAWADHSRWPEITQQEQWDDVERARLRGELKPPVEPLTMADKRAILAQLSKVSQRMRHNMADPTAWARRLQRKEEEGERLNDTQKQAWRNALGPRNTGDEA